MFDNIILENENGQLEFNFDLIELKTSPDFVEFLKSHYLPHAQDFTDHKIIIVESETIFQIMIKSISAYNAFYYDKIDSTYNYHVIPSYIVDMLDGTYEFNTEGVLYSNV